MPKGADIAQPCRACQLYSPARPGDDWIVLEIAIEMAVYLSEYSPPWTIFAEAWPKNQRAALLFCHCICTRARSFGCPWVWANTCSCIRRRLSTSSTHPSSPDAAQDHPCPRRPGSVVRSPPGNWPSGVEEIPQMADAWPSLVW